MRQARVEISGFRRLAKEYKAPPQDLIFVVRGEKIEEIFPSSGQNKPRAPLRQRRVQARRPKID
jgi:hypothetical protein